MSDAVSPVKPAGSTGSLGSTGGGAGRRAQRRPRQRAQRRDELLRAAMRAIRQHGPDVAMEHIAAAAGVSKPILYRHFRDKADLYMAVSEHATQHMRTALLAQLHNHADDLPTVLGLVIDTYLGFIEQEPELYRFVVRRSFPDRPVSHDPVTTNSELIASALGAIFAERLDSLGMDSGGAQTWAHAGVGMVQTAGDWWLERRTLSRAALRDYLLMMVQGAVEAILRSAGRPAGRPEYRGHTENPTRRLSPGPIST